MSQERLGERLSLTFQQVQKYERGANRIGAGRLYELSRVLDVPVGFFFEGMSSSTHAEGLAEETTPYDGDPMSRRETLILVRAYYAIANADVRRRMLDLLKALGGSDGDPEESDDESA